MNYKGIIIEESLEDNSVLDMVRILETKVEKVTEEHKTPWIDQWTMHTVEINEDRADETAEKISRAMDHKHNWYADFKNADNHLIIFRDKIFKVDRNRPEEYKTVKKYGLSLGIPDYQLDFSSDIK